MVQLRLTMSEYSSYQGEVDRIHASNVIEGGSMLQTLSNFFSSFRGLKVGCTLVGNSLYGKATVLVPRTIRIGVSLLFN